MRAISLGAAATEEEAAAAKARAEAEAEELPTETEASTSVSESASEVSEPFKLAWSVVDDTAVRMLPGGWEGARADIVRARAQPSLLFYEAMVE